MSVTSQLNPPKNTRVSFMNRKSRPNTPSPPRPFPVTPSDIEFQHRRHKQNCLVTLRLKAVELPKCELSCASRLLQTVLSAASIFRVNVIWLTATLCNSTSEDRRVM